MIAQHANCIAMCFLLMASSGALRADDSPKSGLEAQRDALRKVKTPTWFDGANWEAAPRLDQAVMGWLKAREGARDEQSQDDMRSSFEDGRSESWEARKAMAKLLSNKKNASNRPEDWSSGMETYEQGLNAFHYLAALGLSDALEELGQKSPTMGKFDKDDYGNTSLDYAAVFGRAEVIRILQGHHQMVPNILECSRPLCLAAAMGHAEAVRELLRDVPMPMAKDSSGKSALDYAMESGNQATIDVLLPKALKTPGFRPGLQPLKNFRGPVLAAIDNGRVDALRSLARNVKLTDDLEPEHRNMFDPKNRINDEVDEEIELFEGLRDGSIDPASIHIPRGTKLLHYAAAHSTPEVAEFLIKSVKIEASSFDENGDPPLFFAESAKMAEFLIGEDPSLLEHSDAKDQTVAHHLARRKSGEALAVVLKMRPQLIAAKDAEGRTPLEIAVTANATSPLAVLLTAGVDPKLTVKEAQKEAHGVGDHIAQLIHSVVVEGKVAHLNSTLMHVAARAGAKESASILMARRLDRNAVDDCGRTPLIIALIHNQRDFAKWLLDEPAKGDDPKSQVNVNVATKHGCRAIHYAAVKGNTEIIERLIKLGADVNVAVGADLGALGKTGAVLDGCGTGLESDLTPFDFARANRHWNALNMLRKAGAKSSGKFKD